VNGVKPTVQVKKTMTIKPKRPMRKNPKKSVQTDTLVSKADSMIEKIDNIIKEYPSFTKNNEIVVANKVMSDLPAEDLKKFFNDR